MANKLAKLVAVPAAPKPSQAQIDADMRYRAEEALRTITRAEECKRDKALMKHVKKLAKTQVKAVCK
ncbi:MAG TPA: hypothetical protein VFX37_10545 [Pseudolabrys sp.]|nr:hypothetical protein [Pseudolabrys sp.]